MPQSPLMVVHQPEAIDCLNDPVKQSILRALREEGSAASIGPVLGQPRQRLAYHVRKLEQAGLLEHLRDERKGNCTERILRATARRYVLAPGALCAGGDGAGDLDAGQLQDSLSGSRLIALASKAIDDMVQVTSEARAGNRRVATLSLDACVAFSSAAEQARFRDELSAAITRIASRYPVQGTEGERVFRMVSLAWPELARPELKQEEPEHEQ